MGQKFNLLIQEAKIHMYSMLREFYRCRALKHQYNVVKMNEYTKKVNDLSKEFEQTAEYEFYEEEL